MDGSAIATIITGILTLTGVIITVLAGNSSRDSKMDHKIDMLNSNMSNQLTLFNQTVNSKFTAVNDSVTRLEKKQEKYNNLQERTYVLERDYALLNQQLQLQGTSIDELKKSIEEK